MTKFQTGGVKNKGFMDNLLVLRGLIDHSKYLKKELWITFHDIEKCFDSLWLEDCINSQWRCAVEKLKSLLEHLWKYTIILDV